MTFCLMHVRLIKFAECKFTNHTSLPKVQSSPLFCLPNLTRPNQPPNLTLQGQPNYELVRQVSSSVVMNYITNYELILQMSSL